MKLSEVNALDRAAFVERLGWVFEHSPWVAERAWEARPFATREALHQAMVAEVEKGSREEKRALLRAHPDLGTRARVSEASTAEQAGVGLDQLTHAEFEKLHGLNTRYKAKFGFPFLFAVKGSTKQDILQTLERRVEDPVEQEFEEALRQVYRIAGFRLADSVEADSVE